MCTAAGRVFQRKTDLNNRYYPTHATAGLNELACQYTPLWKEDALRGGRDKAVPEDLR